MDRALPSVATLLNALTAYIPPTSPVAVIETFQEWQPSHPHPVRTVAAAQSEETTGQPSMRDVVNILPKDTHAARPHPGR